MKVYFCHKDFEPGLICTSKNGEICSGGRFCSCEHKKDYPPQKKVPPMPPVKDTIKYEYQDKTVFGKKIGKTENGVLIELTTDGINYIKKLLE